MKRYFQHRLDLKNKYLILFFLLATFGRQNFLGAQMGINIIPIENFEIRDDGFIKIDLKNLPLPSDFLNHQQIVLSIPPKGIGGNHKHPRRELFISLSDNLELHWIDKEGIHHRNKMKEGNQFYLFDILPFVPHAIINVSQKVPAFLLEFADDLQHNVQPYQVLDMN